MTLSRRSLLASAFAGPLVGGARIAAAQAASLPTDRWAPQSQLRFWRNSTPDIGSDPSQTAPGWYPKTAVLNLHQPGSGPRIAAAEAGLLKRKLDLAFDALMAQPSLCDIRGASLDAAINVSKVGTADGVRLIHAVLSLNAKTIVWGDPKTVERDGRFLTPWQEGSVLRLFLNPYQFLAGRGVQAEGVAGGVLHVRTGAAYGMFVADRLPAGEWAPRSEAALIQHDRSWYEAGAEGAHPMLVHASSYAQENDLLSAGRLRPTSAYARLVAAMFMVDWQALHARMVAQT